MTDLTARNGRMENGSQYEEMASIVKSALRKGVYKNNDNGDKFLNYYERMKEMLLQID
jgi:hypothetical protein